MKLISPFKAAIPLFCGLLLLMQARSTSSQQTDDAPIDVLSDTMGVNFDPYLARVLHDVRLNWYNLVPRVAHASQTKTGKVTIEFVILKNGKVEGMTLIGSSGDVSMDRGAWGGITASSPFPPLPPEFSGQYLALRFKFFYNPKKGYAYPPKRTHSNSPGVISLTLNPFLSESPRYAVRVPAGRTQQFSVTVNVAGDGRVLWSVGGTGCEAADCGTVSDTGLYKAPSTVPEHARIQVKATLAADLIRTVSAAVVVVPNPSN